MDRLLLARVAGVFLALVYSCLSRAELTSWRNAHPVGWMYDPPVGESPGWSTDKWFNLEVSQANIWNNRAEFTDRRNGNIYAFKADYEQTTAVIETGFAPTKWLGLSLEIPYANHNGGFLDDFTDQFHVLARTDRFLREYYPKFGNDMVVQTNGNDKLASGHAEGVGNLKAKAKFWLLQWRSPTPGACDCGLSVSTQVKFPVQRRESGLTSGKHDYSMLLHLGLPYRTFSGVYVTGAITKNGFNETFAEWPQRQWQQMYELALDMGIDAHWGIIAQARVESPLFEQKYLRYNFMYADADAQAQERISSGWNALTEWRGSEILGVRYRWGEGSRINFMMMEDWGLGDRDHIGSWNYVNDAPDYAFITQWHFTY